METRTSKKLSSNYYYCTCEIIAATKIPIFICYKDFATTLHLLLFVEDINNICCHD